MKLDYGAVLREDNLNIRGENERLPDDDYQPDTEFSDSNNDVPAQEMESRPRRNVMGRVRGAFRGLAMSVIGTDPKNRRSFEFR